MSFHVKDDFKAGMPISGVGADWFNKVGSFLNALAGGLGVKLFKPAKPSTSNPITISVDPDRLKEILEEAPVEEGTAKSLAKSVEYTTVTNTSDKSWKLGDVVTENKETLPVGATFQIVSRIVSVGGVAYQFYLREMKVDSKGCITSISKEKGYFEIVSL